MKNPGRWRKRLLITEFLALGALLVAMYALQHFHSTNPASTWIWLLVLALASLLLFVSFLGLTYLGWFSGEGSSPAGKVRRILFALLAVALLGVWVYAVRQTWQRLEIIRYEIRAGEMMESPRPHPQPNKAARPGSIQHEVLRSMEPGNSMPRRSLDRL